MQFRELTNQEFIDFFNNFELQSIYQTPEYGMIMNKQGYESILLGLLENNKIIAASLILIIKTNGFKYAYAPKGYLLDYKNTELLKIFSNYLKKYLSKKGIMGIKINPLIIKNIHKYKTTEEINNISYDYIYNQMYLANYYHLGYNNFFESLKPRFEAIIDLNKPINTLFNNIKKEYRTKIRTCYKNGIRVYKGSIDDIDSLENFTIKKYDYSKSYFKDCYEYYSKRNMVDLYYTKLDTKQYLQSIQNKFNDYEYKSNMLNNEIMQKYYYNPDKLVQRKLNVEKYLNQYENDLVFATNVLKNNPNGIITAAVLAIKQNDTVTILIDSYDKRFKRLNSKHLLIWQLIEIYHKLGYKKFNLGGLSNITTKNNKFAGLNEFKVGFGADVYEFAGDFELITNRRNYELYRNFMPMKKLMKDKLAK